MIYSLVFLFECFRFESSLSWDLEKKRNIIRLAFFSLILPSRICLFIFISFIFRRRRTWRWFLFRCRSNCIRTRTRSLQRRKLSNHFNEINKNSNRFLVWFDKGGVCGPRSRCCLGDKDDEVRRLRFLSRLDRFFRDDEFLKI